MRPILSIQPLSTLADLPLPAADFVEPRARAPVLKLYKQIAVAYGQDPVRWASTSGTALGRVALPYSVKQLNKWLTVCNSPLGALAPVLARQWGLLFIACLCRRVGFMHTCIQEVHACKVGTCLLNVALVRICMSFVCYKAKQLPK